MQKACSRITFFSATVLLTACSTGPTAEWPWEKDAPCKARCTPQESAAAFVTSVGYCRKVQNYYEQHGFYASNSKFWMGAVGTLSGAVAAPLAGGAAKNAWAGLSGSTSALQTGFEEGFSSAVYVRRRSSVATAGKDGILQYSHAESDDQRVAVAVAMAFNCSVAAADADSAALRAISTAQVSNPNPVSNAHTEAAAKEAQTQADVAAKASLEAEDAKRKAEQAASNLPNKALIDAAAERARSSADKAEQAAQEAETIAKPK